VIVQTKRERIVLRMIIPIKLFDVSFREASKSYLPFICSVFEEKIDGDGS